MQLHRYFLCLGVLLGVAAGCLDRPPAVSKPDWDPADSAQQAVSDADVDGDQKLSAKELKAYPALSGMVGELDKDGDGALTVAEIEPEFELWADRGAGLRSLSCSVMYKGRPLNGATVEFEPESFMGGSIQPCTGVTDESGRARMSIDKQYLPDDMQDLPAVHLGFYKVRITHPSIDLEAKYNDSTTLGAAVSPTVREVVLKL
ncbi:EF-hand domain-containing protein [Aeoliella mucimassa]|uniref:EF-hand domain-containing protein n=1 Tax=Aeoliella mucimassa TaxID=2527972 RepID=A0A518AQJ6_9BACT|nr:hypothetical protein [Aeoliella mucimassa]QDU56994.1 hypothetical protein Pan181_32060 [Aeoliella mucimassa]